MVIHNSEIPLCYLMSIFIMLLQFVCISPRFTSSHWKLNTKSGKIENNFSVQETLSPEELESVHIFNILSQRISRNWKVLSDLELIKDMGLCRDGVCISTLTCDDVVNHTKYDKLIGISLRYTHPRSKEPEIASDFLEDGKEMRLPALERKLKELKLTIETQSDLFLVYVMISKYHRLRGEVGAALDCLRKASLLQPSDSTVPLDMAAILYKLKYLDDALHLARKSLEILLEHRDMPIIPVGQYLLMSKILSAYGNRNQEAIAFAGKALSMHTISLEDKYIAMEIVHNYDVEAKNEDLSFLNSMDVSEQDDIDRSTYGIIATLFVIVAVMLCCCNPAQKMSFSWPKLNWYTSIPGDDDDYTVDPEQALADSMMEHAKIEVIYPANMTSDSSKGCGHTCQRSSRRRRK